jgi:uncharacterized phage infection (PIP) family protein YhgE
VDIKYASSDLFDVDKVRNPKVKRARSKADNVRVILAKNEVELNNAVKDLNNSLNDIKTSAKSYSNSVTQLFSDAKTEQTTTEKEKDNTKTDAESNNYNAVKLVQQIIECSSKIKEEVESFKEWK